MRLKSLFYIIPWSICALAVLTSWFSSIEFDERSIKLASTFLFVCGLPIIFALNTTNMRVRKSLFKLSLLLILTTAIGIQLTEMIHFENGYKTQTVLYRSKSNRDSRIEFQMEDQGAFGYDQRTVKITPIFYFFSKIEKTNESKIDKSKWDYVNEDLNELGLKYP